MSSDLKKFIEDKYNCVINLSDDDLKDFVNFYELYYFDKDSMIDELCDYWELGEWLMDFIKVKELAEYSNYTCINDNLYIDDNGLDYFENSYNTYGKNIDNMINDWRE